jgi:hypothetical protein
VTSFVVLESSFCRLRVSSYVTPMRICRLDAPFCVTSSTHHIMSGDDGGGGDDGVPMLMMTTMGSHFLVGP